MPIYEYRCSACKRRFALLVGVTTEKAKRACPRCDSRRIAKLISRIAPIVRQNDFDDDLDEADLEGADDEFGDDDDFDDDFED